MCTPVSVKSVKQTKTGNKEVFLSGQAGVAWAR